MMDKTDRSIYICSLNPGKSSVTSWQTQGNSFLLIPSVPAEQGHLLEAPHLEQGTECPIYLLHGRFSLAAQYTMKGLRSHEPSQTLRVLKFSRIPPSHISCLTPHRSQLSMQLTISRHTVQFHTFVLLVPSAWNTSLPLWKLLILYKRLKYHLHGAPHPHSNSPALPLHSEPLGSTCVLAFASFCLDLPSYQFLKGWSHLPPPTPLSCTYQK